MLPPLAVMREGEGLADNYLGEGTTEASPPWDGPVFQWPRPSRDGRPIPAAPRPGDMPRARTVPEWHEHDCVARAAAGARAWRQRRDAEAKARAAKDATLAEPSLTELLRGFMLWASDFLGRQAPLPGHPCAWSGGWVLFKNPSQPHEKVVDDPFEESVKADRAASRSARLRTSRALRKTVETADGIANDVDAWAVALIEGRLRDNGAGKNRGGQVEANAAAAKQ